MKHVYRSARLRTLPYLRAASTAAVPSESCSACLLGWNLNAVIEYAKYDWEVSTSPEYYRDSATRVDYLTFDRTRLIWSLY